MDHDFCRATTRGDAAAEAHLRLQGHTPRLTALDEELLSAAKEGNAIRAQVAILGGADVQVRCRGSTALVHPSGPSSITSPGSLQVERELTALMLAATGGHLDVVWLLLEARARADAAAPDGRQPVHFAATVGRYDVCLALVSAGADASATDHAGRTVLDYLPETMASPERAHWQRLPGGQLPSTGLDMEGSRIATESPRQDEVASEFAAAPLKICSPYQPSEGSSTAKHPLSTSESGSANARPNVPRLHMKWLQPLPESMQRMVDHGPALDVISCSESDYTDYMTTDRGTATHPLSTSESGNINARPNVPRLHMKWLQPLPESMQRMVDHGPDFDVNSCSESDFTDLMTTDRGTSMTHRSLTTQHSTRSSTERLTQRAANLEKGNPFANKGMSSERSRSGGARLQ